MWWLCNEVPDSNLHIGEFPVCMYFVLIEVLLFFVKVYMLRLFIDQRKKYPSDSYKITSTINSYNLLAFASYQFYRLLEDYYSKLYGFITKLIAWNWQCKFVLNQGISTCFTGHRLFLHLYFSNLSICYTYIIEPCSFASTFPKQKITLLLFYIHMY